MKTKAVLLITIILIVILGSCESAPDIETTSFSTAPLYGMIYDDDNLPVSNVEIKIDDFTVVKSDINGRFIANGLSRGTHSFEVTKKDFKLYLPNNNPFQYDFINREQFLYLKMVSIEQIIAKVEENIKEQEWEDARSGLLMATEINPENKIVLYLTAILHYQRRQYNEAIISLDRLLDLGSTESGVFLTLADIFEYKLGDPMRAHAALLEYVSLYKDDSFNSRIQNLVKFVPADKRNLNYTDLRLRLKEEREALEKAEAEANKNEADNPLPEGESFPD